MDREPRAPIPTGDRVWAAMSGLTLGLDWDGTASHYRGEVAVLAAQAHRIVIITLNDAITPGSASAWLRVSHDRIHVEHCPDERVEDYWAWKVERCTAHGVSLMVDDDRFVCEACWAAGVPCLWVVEKPLALQ